MAKKLWCRASAGLTVAIVVKDQPSGSPVDITGWTFACSFARVRGANDVNLGMALSASADGFFITLPSGGGYQMSITPDTLLAVSDTSGDFTMFGDIIATLPSGARQWMDDIELEVTTGPTA